MGSTCIVKVHWFEMGSRKYISTKGKTGDI